LRKSTFFTLAFYVFSAWIYSEVYIWSRSSKSRLGFTDAGRAHERFKLNERPFFLRFLFVVLAITQAAIHLWDDYDLIQVPSMKPKQVREDKDTTTAASVRGLPKPRQVLVKQLPNMVGMAGYITGTALSLGTAAYFVGPRSTVWDYYYSFSRLVISLAKTSKPTGLAPFLPLVFGFFTEGMLLVFLWQVVNKAFDLYITQEPLKNDLPITTDSRDPNGTLLNGLRSKKEAVKVSWIP
jgi:nucleoporin NDC1